MRSAEGARVSASRFAQLTNFQPAAGSVERSESTLHIIDGGTAYIVPADAVIERSAAGMTITVGHLVRHLSTKARIVGHGLHRHWTAQGR